jgi:phage-related minor tail protein
MLQDMALEAVNAEIRDVIREALGGILPGGKRSDPMIVNARADGGPVTGGLPYLVGERGPEIVVPRQSGTVVPNHRLGGTVVINQYITTPDVQGFRHSQGQIYDDAFSRAASERRRN